MSDAPPPKPDSLWLRLAVTLLAPLAAVLGGRVLLPGVDAEALQALPGGKPADLSVVAVGVGPFISAAILVELGAAVIPPWNALATAAPRGGAGSRAPP